MEFLWPELELNSSSLLDEAVLDDKKTIVYSLSASSIFKNARAYYSLAQEYQYLVWHDPL